jgi:hypothetical protein
MKNLHILITLLLTFIAMPASAEWLDIHTPFQPCDFTGYDENSNPQYTLNMTAIDNYYQTCQTFGGASACRYANDPAYSNLCGETYNHIEYWPLGTCPTGYTADANGDCIEQPSCPTGQVDIGSGCEDICLSGNTTTLMFKLGTAPFTWTDTAGCNSTFAGNEDCVLGTDGFYHCTFDYIQDGTYTDPSTFDYSQQPNETDGSLSVSDIPLPSSTETTTTTQTNETIANGTSTTTTDTTTQTNDVGTTIETIGNTVVKKDSNGSIIEIVTQTVNDSYNDGTSQKTVTITTTGTPAIVDTTTYDIEAQTTTNTTTQSGASGTITNTTIYNYDEYGQVTNSSTTQSGGLTGDSSTAIDGSGDGSGYCNHAPVLCDIFDWLTGDVTYPTDIAVPWETVEPDTDYNSGLPTSGTCPQPYTINLGFGSSSYDVSYQPFCDLASQARPLVLIAAYLLAAYILIGSIRGK